MESSCIAHRYTKSTPTSSSLLSSTVIFHMHWCFGHPRPPPPGHTKLWMLGKMISCKFNVEIAAFALWCNIFVNLQFGKPIFENMLPKVIYCVKRKEKNYLNDSENKTDDKKRFYDFKHINNWSKGLELPPYDIFAIFPTSLFYDKGFQSKFSWKTNLKAFDIWRITMRQFWRTF